MSERKALAVFDGHCVFCRGRIGRFTRAGGNGQLCVLLRQVRIEDTISVDHIWVREGLPEYVSKYALGEWISFNARVGSYTHIETGRVSYGLYYPEEIVRSYS